MQIKIITVLPNILSPLSFSLCLHSWSSSDDYPEIQRLFPYADIQYIPDASHWIHADKPLDFISSISSFLQS